MATYGIDLGTTYSCIATLDENGNPRIIQNLADGTDTLASAVFFDSEDNTIVGSAAKDMVETDGDRVVQFVKRQIGKPNARTYEFFGKTYNPVDISALILKRIKQYADEQGEDVHDVVITCPAYFGYEEKDATKKAGELAGLNVLTLINEPTAAALSYCARQFSDEKTILVYDLGGGTFDVTIMKMSLVTNSEGKDVQKIKVISSGGNDLLGGKDWDDKLFNFILNAFCEENGLTPDDIDAETRQSIRSKVEITKKKLSNVESTKVKISKDGQVTNITVSRSDFEAITADLVAQTMTYVEETLNKAGNVDIDLVLLVGGSSYMPMIRNAVENRFPGKVKLHDPDRAVAAGAAIYASMLVEEDSEPKGPEPGPYTEGPGPDPGEPKGSVPGTDSPITLVDITSRSFGPGVLMNNVYMIDNIIKINTEMPAIVEKTYYTVNANQSGVLFCVFENMSKEEAVVPSRDSEGNEQKSNPSDCVKYLGELELPLPPNTPAGAPIDTTFQVDAGGIYVKVTNPQTGESKDATITYVNTVDTSNSPVKTMTVSAE